MSQRILVVHVAGIGDAAVASTLLERLRAEQAGVEITWVCGDAAGPIVRLFDGVARVITVDQRALFHGSPIARARVIAGLWVKLIGRGFDRAIVLHPDPRYRVLTLPLIGTRKSFLSRARHGRMNPVPARFLGDEYARLAGGDANAGPIVRRYAMSDLRARFRAQPAEAHSRVALVPGGSKNALREDSLRRWPVTNYAELARELIADGVEVVLVGAAHDAWVRPAFEGVPVVDRIGELSLTDTLSLLAQCELVISHDTGPMHLARLVRTPLIALFGPTNPGQVVSIDETVTVLWGGEALACRPCFDGREFANCHDNLCMQSISPSRVVAAARRMLGQRASQHVALSRTESTAAS